MRRLQARVRRGNQLWWEEVRSQPLSVKCRISALRLALHSPFPPMACGPLCICLWLGSFFITQGTWDPSPFTVGVGRVWLGSPLLSIFSHSPHWQIHAPNKTECTSQICGLRKLTILLGMP